MSAGSKNLHNFDLPSDLKWAHKKYSSSRHPSNPSSQSDSEDLNQEPTQPKPGTPPREAADSSFKPRVLRPRKPKRSPSESQAAGVSGVHRNEKRVKKKKEKLFISLTKEEIEEDLYAMTGEMPTRKPKRRPKAEQKKLDNLFPGLRFDGMSADMYRADKL